MKQRSGLWVTLLVALFYVGYLGVHWLPLGWGPNELAASAARVWDVRQQVTQNQDLPWWTPWFMSGSSYGLNHARGLYLLPWGVLAGWFDLAVAGKLMCLGAIFLSALAMYVCAHRLLQNQWAAVLAALAYLLHPQQLMRAAASEHVTISLSFLFVPLLWWAFARALATNRWRDILLCAVVGVGLTWADNKQALAHLVFLTGYLIYWLWPAERRQHWQQTARTTLFIGLSAAVLGAFVIVPALTEQKLVKLFVNEPVVGWQKNYSFKSLLALVDRDGAVTRTALHGVQNAMQSQLYRPSTQAELQELQQDIQRVGSLASESPEKYAGLVLLAALAATMLFNSRRQDGLLFWTLVGLLLLSVMLSTAHATVLSANWQTLGAWFGLAGIPGSARLAGLLALAVLAAFLVLFWKRKLRTTQQRWLAAAVLAVFLLTPAFALISRLPLFGEIRAPFVFYDGPAMFLGALLIGFLVTDVLAASKWRSRLPLLSAAVGLLLLIDYWPYQSTAKQNPVPPRTAENLRAAYAALAKDRDFVKTYSVSSRYFHLLGPIYSGKPQVYEAFYNWMAPLGTGLINQHAFASWDTHRAFLNLMGARYIVFDKTDPSNQGNAQLAGLYRQSYPVELENEDFVVFRNQDAHPFLVAYERACLFSGPLPESPPVALALAAAGWPLVHATNTTTGNFARVYQTGSRVVPPATPAVRVPLQDLEITRPRHGLVHVKASTPTACTLVIAESHFPFWTATLNGQAVAVQRISTALLGVELPAGASELTLRYQIPGSYKAAGLLSALGLLACLLGIVWPQRPRA